MLDLSRVYPARYAHQACFVQLQAYLLLQGLAQLATYAVLQPSLQLQIQKQTWGQMGMHPCPRDVCKVITAQLDQQKQSLVQLALSTSSSAQSGCTIVSLVPLGGNSPTCLMFVNLLNLHVMFRNIIVTFPIATLQHRGFILCRRLRTSYFVELLSFQVL